MYRRAKRRCGLGLRQPFMLRYLSTNGLNGFLSWLLCHVVHVRRICYTRSVILRVPFLLLFLVLCSLLAAPDGYTLLLGSASEIALYPAVVAKVPYDSVRDFAPIALASDIPFLLVTHPSLPVRSTQELIALARARPGEINYGSAGNGSTSHLTMAMFGSLTRTKLVHIPYKGSAPATADLV